MYTKVKYGVEVTLSVEPKLSSATKIQQFSIVIKCHHLVG